MMTLGELLRERKEEIMEGIKACIRIDSVMGEPEEGAPYGRGPKEALEYALNLGERLGLRTKNVDDRAGWVEIGEGEEMIAVLGHLDVVPLGDGWHYPGFGAVEENGKIYGRGIMDDKGPTIGAIYALKAISDLQIPLDRRIRVIFGTNEENGSTCIRHYVSCGEEIPVAGFTPDGDYPLIFCEKGMTTLWVGKKKVTDGERKVRYFKGGLAANVVTPECVLKVEGELEIEQTEGVLVSCEDGITTVRAEGKGVHGSMPEQGVNAAIRLLNAVRRNHFGGDFQNMMDFLLEKIGTETNGTKLGIHYFDEETGETTVNVGLVEYGEEGMSVSLDIRYPQNGEPDRVYEMMKKWMDQYQLEILRCTTEKVLYVPKDSELIQKLMKVYREKTGRTEEPMAIGGGTYAKMFPNMVAFGPGFPGDPVTIHQPDECAEIEKLLLSIEMSAEAMVSLATKETV